MDEVIFVVGALLVVIVAVLFLLRMACVEEIESTVYESRGSWPTPEQSECKYEVYGCSEKDNRRSDKLSIGSQKTRVSQDLNLSLIGTNERDFPGLPVKAISLAEEIWGADEDTFPLGDTIVTKFGITLTRRDLMKLKCGDWINDEIINFFTKLIVERASENARLPKVYAFNSFFYTSLTERGFSYIKKWTKCVDIFAYDLILVPVHYGAHWCLAVIDVQRKVIEYYDSVRNDGMNCIMNLKDYLIDECLDKRNILLDIGEWSFCCLEKIPAQLNGSDCGVFVCRFAEYVSRRQPINFKQTHMYYFRVRMLYELCTAKLM